MQLRWWSKTILIGAVIAAVLLPIGALGTKFGLWSYVVGFRFLFVSAVLAAVGLFGGIVGIFIAVRKDLAADKKPVYLGTFVSLLIVAVLFLQLLTARSVPPIHNISTDTVDPPAFAAIVAVRGEDSNPLDYDAAKLAELQLGAYPSVKTMITDKAPAASFDRSVEVLGDMGLEIVNADAAAGIVEATDESFWFGFKDDVVVRLRPADSGTTVDLRSVSRVGLSDLGQNARRIMEFLEQF